MRSSRSERTLPECEGSLSTTKKHKNEESHRQWKDTT